MRSFVLIASLSLAPAALAQTEEGGEAAEQATPAPAAVAPAPAVAPAKAAAPTLEVKPAAATAEKKESKPAPAVAAEPAAAPAAEALAPATEPAAVDKPAAATPALEVKPAAAKAAPSAAPVVAPAKVAPAAGSASESATVVPAAAKKPRPAPTPAAAAEAKAPAPKPAPAQPAPKPAPLVESDPEYTTKQEVEVLAREFFLSVMNGDARMIVDNSAMPFSLEAQRISDPNELFQEWLKHLRSKRTDLLVLYGIEILTAAEMEQKYGKPPARLSSLQWKNSKTYFAVGNLSGNAAVALFKETTPGQFFLVGYTD